MTTTINAVASTGLVQTSDGSGVIKVQSNGVTTNALAWVNFNGNTSPGTIRASFNVTSVTKNATGDYTLNFTNALADANYAIVGSSGGTNGTTAGAIYLYDQATARTSSLCRILGITTAGGTTDAAQFNVAIFGN